MRTCSGSRVDPSPAGGRRTRAGSGGLRDPRRLCPATRRGQCSSRPPCTTTPIPTRPKRPSTAGCNSSATGFRVAPPGQRLRPPVLDAFGVVAAIEHLVLQARGPEGPIELDIEPREMAADGRFHRLAAKPLENALFRIVQESLKQCLEAQRSPKIRRPPDRRRPARLRHRPRLGRGLRSRPGDDGQVGTPGRSASGRGCSAARTGRSKARRRRYDRSDRIRWPRKASQPSGLPRRRDRTRTSASGH